MFRLVIRLIRNSWQRKIFRFACVGIINTFTDLTILNFLVFIGHLYSLVANLISATISITISYFLNRRLVFKDPNPRNLKQFIHFFLITGLSILAIQSVIISFFTHTVGIKSTFVVTVVRDIGVNSISIKAINLNTAKLIAVLVSMIWNFILYHKIVFKHVSEKNSLEEDRQ